VSALRQWRIWVLVLLLVGPVLAYLGLGMLWLWERGWIVATAAAGVWVLAGVVFAVLAARWTKAANPIMPPLDWDSPQTFSPLDREAWKLVQEEADRGETLPYDSLLGGDVYIETGRRLLNRLAAHYHPHATNLLDDVPLVELLTAFELAAEDLAGLCRNIPGGDLTTLSHWKRVVQLSGYITKANDLYSYLLPFLNPVGGLARLGTREWIVKPAWKSMQQNVLRWFFQAYVNRIGVHLIELLSGRLAIGANQYRRLTRRPVAAYAVEADDIGPLNIAMAGARGAGKSRLVALIKQTCMEDSSLIKARLASLGLDPSLLARLNAARWIEAPAYANATGKGETRRERAERQVTVAATIDCDLLVLVVDGRRQEHGEDIAFAKAWDHWFGEHPQREIPPALVVVTGVDRIEIGDGWKPPYDWSVGHGSRESTVRAHFDSLRSLLPPTFHEFVAAGLGDETPFGVLEQVIPSLATQLLRAERTALIRRLHEVAGRSKVGRLVHQLGEQGRSLWGSLKARHGAGTSPR
jgi:uncharacterized protein